MKELLKLMILPVAFILTAYGLRTMELMNPIFHSRTLEPNVIKLFIRKKNRFYLFTVDAKADICQSNERKYVC